jgi:hypothetical protein
MTFDPSQLEQAAREAAMNALEAGVRAGCEYMTELLKASVSSGLPGQSIAGTASPMMYRRETKRGGKWERSPIEWSGGAKLRTRMYSRTGEGARSIGYMILERDDAKGVIRVLIGGDSPENNTRGGFRTLPGYMTGHEFGIRYPTRGIGKGTGPVVQRPWLRNTVNTYWGSFQQVVMDVASQG